LFVKPVSSIKKLVLPVENQDEEKRPFKDRGHYVGDRVIGSRRRITQTLTMDSMKKHRIPLPKPKAHFSGQFNVRVPKDLHRELVREAEEEGVSLNALVTYLLSQSVKIKKAA